MSSFKEAMLTAPRVSRKGVIVNNKRFWNKFRKEYPQYKDLKDTDFNQALKSLHEKFYPQIIADSNGAELPNRMGVISVFSVTTVKKMPNYKESTFKNPVYYRNYESDGYIPKIFFVNNIHKYSFPMSNTWKFDACRNLTQTVSKSFTEDCTKYAKLTKEIYVTSLFREVDEKGDKIKMQDSQLSQNPEDEILNFNI